MRTKLATSYANLFMGVLEDRMINSYAYKPLVYLKYIDDIFMIWTEGEENLNGFSSHCNQINENIQFEQVPSKEKIPFLDVSVIHENGKLHTGLHSKPTDKHQYLYSHSCHPRHTKNSLPYCLALRLRRICSKKPTSINAPKKWNIICYKEVTLKVVLEMQSTRHLRSPEMMTLLIKPTIIN